MILTMYPRTIIFTLALFFVFAFGLSAQSEIYHVEPPNWWHDMNNPYLEIMIHGENIGPMEVEISNKQIKLMEKVSKHRNYIFIYVDLTSVKSASTFNISLKAGDRSIDIPYSLQSKTRPTSSISAEDAIYLITPDRFRNGEPKNDNQAKYRETADRSDNYGRHGGDLQGINQSLNYIKKLGFNTIWLNPVLENNMKEESYHGYATTDYYAVDERFGGNLEYERLRDSLSEKGMKLIMDMIANHCGSYHWWMNEFPFPDWINYQSEYIKDRENFSQLTNHRKTVLHDPYAAAKDRELMTKGWFVPTMPDLNQANPHMSRYIIQNSIWWVETMHLAGIRQDTYPYPDVAFLTEWSCALAFEYPDLFIVGEEWNTNPLIASYWQGGETAIEKLSSSHSCLPSVMDFPLQDVVKQGLTDKETWSAGYSEIYEHMINDLLYPHPEKLVIFPDNHDMDRVYAQMQRDYPLWQSNMMYYATMRGIPQIYYGTEVLLDNEKMNDHGEIRAEMPGGWEDHTKSAFDKVGLSQKEKLAFIFMSRLYNWRSSSAAIHVGEFIHYVPKDNIYVYFRSTTSEQVMVILNKNKEEVVLDVSRFADQLREYNEATNVITFEKVKVREPLTLKAGTSYILEMKK